MNNSVKTYVGRSKLQSETGVRDFEAAKERGGDLMKRCNTLWRYRPIHEGLMRYAALDVVTLYQVKDALEENLSLTGIHLQKLIAASER